MHSTIRLIAVASLAFALLLTACKNDNDVTPGGSTGSLSDTISDNVNAQKWTDTISIVWSGAQAEVSGSVDSVSITRTDGYVTVVSTAKHVVYLLSGSGQGQLSLYSAYKLNLTLDGLTLACSDGPAINNQGKKSCFVVLNGTNSLSDGSTYATSTEDRKAALFSEGQVIVSGTGSLGIQGQYKHGLASDDYIHIAAGTGTIGIQAAADGLHANDGIYIDGGTIEISAGNDGIQCDTSLIAIKGGTTTISSATDKGIIAYGDILINGGTIRVESDYKCIKTKSNLVINGGDIQVICHGEASSGGGPGGWGGGNSSDSSPEGIEAKGKVTINGGTVYAQSADDAINSGDSLTINGGRVCAYSTNNDGLDANGHCVINGGVVYVIGSRDPEVGIDANTEKNYQLFINGGTIVAIGGLERGSALNQDCLSVSSWDKNTWYALYNGITPVLAFKTPSSGGSKLVVSTAGNTSLDKKVTANGTAIWNGMGIVSPTVSGGTNVSLSTYSSSSGGGPGW